MKNQKGFTSIELSMVLFLLIGGWGWIWNIVKITSSNFEVITGMLIFRLIGVLAFPVGVVMGFL